MTNSTQMYFQTAYLATTDNFSLPKLAHSARGPVTKTRCVIQTLVTVLSAHPAKRETSVVKVSEVSSPDSQTPSAVCLWSVSLLDKYDEAAHMPRVSSIRS